MVRHSNRRSTPGLIGWVSFLCALQAAGTEAFSVRSTYGRSAVPLWLQATHQEQQPGSSNKKKKRAPKPPRFTQTVHGAGNNSKNNNNKQPAARPKPDGGSGNVQKDRMWNSRKKSIEELEGIMNKRWGTDLNAWTAQDYYDEDDDEEEVEDYQQQLDDALLGPQQQEQQGGVVRARPVKDPWQKPAEASQPPSSTSSIFGGSPTQQDLSLQRVRKNQERVQRERNNNNQMTPEPPRQEFYDEDDEGYEKEEGSLDFMISPQPAGGQGRLKQQPEPPKEAPTPGGGFFFRENTAESSNEAANAEPAEEAKPAKRKITPSEPMLDPESGKPLLLTLEQAERNFRQSLLAQKATDRDDDEMDLDSAEDESAYNMLASSSSWQDLGITNEILLENLQDMKCETPLSVQEKACPKVLSGKDVVIGTYTGSGKTLAFLTPVIQQLIQDNDDENQSANNRNVRAMVIAPGRELASQIVAVARELLNGTGLTVMLAIGGTTFSRNLEQLRKRKPDIVVGTPGRLAELVVGRPGERTGRLKTSGLQTVVLDEFDALLEYKAHREPTTAVLQTLKQRYRDNIQSVWCSATASDVIDSDKLESFLNPDYTVAMADQDDMIVTPLSSKSSGTKKGKKEAPRVSKTVIHGVVHVPHRRFVLDSLRRILHTEPIPQQILIFVDNARKVDLMVERLEKVGIVAAPLHGGMRSEKMDRAEVSKALREGFVGIVVATEMAARGLDAPLLTHVINLDLPTDASHYAHRAGRCGRGGRTGVVINFTADPKERNVPQKFADQLGIEMYATEVRNGKLNLVDPKTQQLDGN